MYVCFQLHYANTWSTNDAFSSNKQKSLYRARLEQAARTLERKEETYADGFAFPHTVKLAFDLFSIWRGAMDFNLILLVRSEVF